MIDIDKLREICQKEKLERNKGLTLLNRKVSIYFTRYFISRNISANQISVASIILGVSGSLFFIPGSWIWNILGISLLYISFTFDQVDGELARYYKTVDLNGVYIDEFRHLLIYSITIFCLSFPASSELRSNFPFLLGFLGALSLIIMRINERLPYQIFTDKIILKDNFTGGDFEGIVKNDDMPSENKKQETISNHDNGRGLRHYMGKCFYGGFYYLSQQVMILIWLFAVTIIDFLILNEKGLIGIVSLQTIFFIIFTIYGPLLTLKSIHGHFKEGWISRRCIHIYRVMINALRSF